MNYPTCFVLVPVEENRSSELQCILPPDKSNERGKFNIYLNEHIKGKGEAIKIMGIFDLKTAISLP